jgi:hypothetical protein
MQLDALGCDIDLGALEWLAFPESFRERRALIGWVRLDPNHANRASRIDLANTLNRGSCGHTATND